MNYLINDIVYLTIDKDHKEVIDFLNKTLIKYRVTEDKFIHDDVINIEVSLLTESNDTVFTAIGDECVYVDGKFYLLDNRKKRVEFPFSRLNEESVQIAAEPGCDPEGLYYYVIETIMRYKLIMTKDTLLLHSSAVCYKDARIVFPAWGGTGKSNLLLALLENGAEFYADDLVFLNKDSQIAAYSKPLNLFNYNLKWFPEIKKTISMSRKFLFLIAELTSYLYKLLFSLKTDFIMTKVFGILDRYSKGVTNIKVHADEVFQGVNIGQPGTVDLVLQLVRSNVNTPVIEKSNVRYLVESMDGCHKEEWVRLFGYYQKYKFLSGESCEDLISIISEKEKKLLETSLKNTPIYIIRVPLEGMTKDNYTVSINQIQELIVE